MNNNNNEINEFPEEADDIKVQKIGEDTFRVVFATKTGIEGLFRAFAEIDVDRNALELFVDRASSVLEGESA